jgi:osmotically-inducible protein OsmY
MESLLLSETAEDRRIEGLIRRSLAGSHMRTLRSVTVVVRAGTVTLRGTLRTFYEKQICIECCRRAEGVRAYTDQLSVAPLEMLAAVA